MFPGKAQSFLAVVAIVALAGCDRRAATSGELSPEVAAGFLPSPGVEQAVFADGQVTLLGVASPGAHLRLATPAGAAATTVADRKGRWTVALPNAAFARILGLSMTTAGRRTQAEGYLLIGPRQAAVLRPGAGALRLEPRPAGIGAIDFDRQGAAMISGTAPAGSSLSVRMDGRFASEARADPAGRFSFVLPSLTAGPHRLEVAGDGFTSGATIDATPPHPLVDGPLRSQFSDAGLRADWLTPGGGVQSTVLPP